MSERLQQLSQACRLSLITLILILSAKSSLWAQNQPGAPLSLPGSNQNQIDTNTFNQSNNDDWDNEDIRISYKKLHSKKTYSPDTSIHTFHRRPFSLPWYQDLGNQGTPTENLLFTPEDRFGPTLGYNVFDVYRYNLDSLHYYNTNRPYSVFSYQLASKLEQKAEILHTQNIKPNWNVAFQYRKTTSPGFYQIQRTNHDNGSLATHYKSIDQHYEAYAAIVYNREQQDENGGIVDITELNNDQYSDRATIDVAFRNDNFGTSGSVRRSSVTNTLRDYGIKLHHSYTFGNTDSTYNDDSTKLNVKLIPRFSIAHHFNLTSEKYEYKDVRPDSLRYLPFFTQGFAGDGSDSVFMEQKWMKVDNQLLLNGFLGKSETPLQFTAGIGNRFDNFKTNYIIGTETQNITSLYLIGGLKKEALEAKQWFYSADVQFYFAGSASGNSKVKGELGRDLGNDWGAISIGAQQSINNAPYNYTSYINQYDTITASLNKESITQVFIQLNSNRLGLSAGLRNYLVSNYIYLNSNQQFDQAAAAFNITQIWLQKTFKWRSVVLDNEMVYQQTTGGAPVNIPQIMGRHQLSLERYIFNSKLKIATGVEVRYTTPYKPSGYTPFFNRYYYQNSYEVENWAQGSVFFNFKVKRFRAYLMGDQIQQFFTTNTIVAPGYAAQNFMIRFGFNWVMIN